MFDSGSSVVWIILAGALATYATRVGGHLVLSRFHHIPRRVMAALDAVPAAVLASLVAPAIVSQGWAGALTLAIAAVAALRFNMAGVLLVGAASIITLRALLG